MAYKITGESYEHEGRLWRYDLEARDNGNIANRTFYHPYTDGEDSPPAARRSSDRPRPLHPSVPELH